MNGARPPDIQELVRIRDRISFLYLEHAILSRDASAIVAEDDRGTVHIPAATIGCVLLGPGTSVSHQAVALLAESGSTIVWVGERGVRYYAHGRPLAHTSRLLEAQARLVSSRTTRLGVARKMYELRFDDESTQGLSMEQLRGREGRRVRDTYKEHATRTGLAWRGRQYNPDDFASSDPVNMALSAATSALYGVCQSVIVALGCAPGLGFIHTGNDRSFVYDIADLYKAELAIPIAFNVAASNAEDISAATRRKMRDCFFETHLLERAASDLMTLLLPSGDRERDVVAAVGLWDGSRGVVDAGVNYSES